MIGLEDIKFYSLWRCTYRVLISTYFLYVLIKNNLGVNWAFLYHLSISHTYRMFCLSNCLYLLFKCILIFGILLRWISKKTFKFLAKNFIKCLCINFTCSIYMLFANIKLCQHLLRKINNWLRVVVWILVQFFFYFSFLIFLYSTY